MTSIIWVTIGFTVFAAFMPLILKMVFPHKITTQEILLSVIGSIAVSSVILFLNIASIPSNIEMWHGEITDKKREHVSCSHLYQCGQTCSGTGADRICIPIYCNEHPYDVDWAVYNTVDQRSTVPRIDRRGMSKPPRWDAVAIGESYSREYPYRDYLQLNENSLFNQGSVEGDYSTLVYPRVYDLYRTKLALRTHSSTQVNLDEWNESIRERLEDWGRLHQMNMILVFTEYDRNYFEWLRYQWNGGRKNDAVVIIGTNTEGSSVKWAEVFSWSMNEYFNTKIRSDLLTLEVLDKDQILGIIDDNVSNFERRPMEDFKYLLKERKYSLWLIGLMVFLQLGVNIAIWLIIVNNSETVIGNRYRRFR